MLVSTQLQLTLQVFGKHSLSTSRPIREVVGKVVPKMLWF